LFKKNGKKFIDSFEAYDYPIFATMYHPEYQTIDFIGSKKWDIKQNAATDEIAFRLSLLVNRYGRKNKNHLNGDSLLKKYSVNQNPTLPYSMLGADLKVETYGFNFHKKEKKQKKVKLPKNSQMLSLFPYSSS